jgi:hypothetical protein
MLLLWAAGNIWDLPAMNGNGETGPSSEAKKRPGRPRQPASETQKQKVERLQKELVEAQAALKLSEEKRAAIVGAAALRHARRNTEFARQLATMLRAEIKSKADRTTLADLFADNPADATP